VRRERLTKFAGYTHVDDSRFTTLSSEPNPEECDATGGDSSNEVGNILLR